MANLHPDLVRLLPEEVAERAFPDWSMAFQPIVDVQSHDIWGYEALVRGTNGEPAGAILAQVNDETQYRFDQAARVKAIKA